MRDEAVYGGLIDKYFSYDMLKFIIIPSLIFFILDALGSRNTLFLTLRNFFVLGYIIFWLIRLRYYVKVVAG